MAFVFEQLCIFFCFCASLTVASRASWSSRAFLTARRLFVLTVNFGHNIANFGIRIRLDKVAEQIRQTQKVTESANCIIFLRAGSLAYGHDAIIVRN